MMDFKFTKKNSLNIAIDEAFAQLTKIEIDSEEYDDALARVAELTKLKDNKSSRRVSPDTLAVVGGNLVGILVILYFERTGVVLSKAFNNVIKPK